MRERGIQIRNSRIGPPGCPEFSVMNQSINHTEGYTRRNIHSGDILTEGNSHEGTCTRRYLHIVEHTRRDIHTEKHAQGGDIRIEQTV